MVVATLPMIMDCLFFDGLITVTILDALIVPTLWKPKARLVGNTVIGPIVGGGTGVGVGVGVGVKVGVEVGVGVTLGVGVALGVALGVGVGALDTKAVKNVAMSAVPHPVLWS